jgi:osmotically-inducible protein OsmY
MVRALQIDVDTREGVVTLTGKVKSQVEKDRALTLARETNGVKNVVDRLTIAP